MPTEIDVRSLIADVTSGWSEERRADYTASRERFEAYMEEFKRTYGNDVPTDAVADMIVNAIYETKRGGGPLVGCREDQMKRYLGDYNGAVTGTLEGVYQYEGQTLAERLQIVGHELLHGIYGVDDDAVYRKEAELWDFLSRTGRYGPRMNDVARVIGDISAQRSTRTYTDTIELGLFDDGFMNASDPFFEGVAFQDAPKSGADDGFEALFNMAIDGLMTLPGIAETTGRGIAANFLGSWGFPYKPKTGAVTTDRIAGELKEAYKRSRKK